MDKITLAYLAGAMDSDGYFTIKRSTYHQRVRGDAVNAVYSEVVGLKQVTPEIPALLHECFGGVHGTTSGGTPNSRMLFYFRATDVIAATAAKALMPYLRVKKPQAKTLLELRESKTSRYNQLAYWFEKENPDWRGMELVTCGEAAKILGVKGISIVSQSISNRSLLAIPYDYGTTKPRIPRALLEQLLANQAKDGRSRLMPPQLVAWR